MHVHLADRLLLTGPRARATGLWHLDLFADTAPDDTLICAAAAEPPPSALLPQFHPSVSDHQHSYATHSTAPAELVAFAHAISTLTTALECGHLPACMGLTVKTLRKHPPQSVAMHGKRASRPSPEESTLYYQVVDDGIRPHRAPNRRRFPDQ